MPANLDEAGWYLGNRDVNAHTVGGPQKPENDLGLRKVHGNMAEWRWDWYGDYPGSNVIDPRGPSSGSERLLWGGGWLSEAKHCRLAYRSRLLPCGSSNSIGFCVTRTVVE
ncbi:MAG: formylglycine-generating enzyme family protein [Opitutales bacterium]